MATFIEIRTDAFAKNIKRNTAASVAATPVRRPLRGIEIKDDRYATIRILRADGSSVPLTDAGSLTGLSAGDETSAASGVSPEFISPKTASSVVYSNFIIESIEDSRQEKAQIMETFGEPYVFFFGERPRVLQVSGILFNTLDFNWRTEFWDNYEKRLRGTKLVEQNARMYLHWDDIVVEGYPLGAQASDIADMPYHVRFSFTLFVTNHTYLSSIGTDDYPVRAGVIDSDSLRSQTYDPTYATGADQNQAATKGIQQLTNIGTAAGMALTATALASVIKGNSGTNTHSSLPSKSIIQDALEIGLWSSTMTFMNVIDEYYRNKRTIRPQRKLPMRSKIHDNFDEYLKNGEGGSGPTPPWDMDYVRYMEEQQQTLKTYYDVSSIVQKSLTASGIDPISATANVISHPFNGRSNGVAMIGNPSSNINNWGA
jgi:hypothetical protein